MDSKWLDQFQQKLNLNDPVLLGPSISKVPRVLRTMKNEAYSPKRVSIGPYHHGSLDQSGMEEHKLRCMKHLLSLVNNREEILRDCVDCIRNLDRSVRGCYAHRISSRIGATELVEIVLVDGCFILDLFYRQIQHRNNAFTADPTLRHDLVLLENQIPFFILEKLYSIIFQQGGLNISDQDQLSLTSLALSFFHQQVRNNIVMPTEADHLLDLLHQSWLPSPPAAAAAAAGINIINGSRRSSQAFHVGAAELVKAGIQFQNISSESHLLLDISFDGGSGVIKIPTLPIDDEMETLLRNLIALEQCGFNNTSKSFHVSSYALLLKSLITSSEDVRLLEERGIIIISDLEKDESILTLINALCNNIHVKRFHFGGLCKEVSTYCEDQSRLQVNQTVPLEEKRSILDTESPSPSISKVPDKLRSSKKEAYSPQMVSIGPYHHRDGDDSGLLLCTEKHKREYARTLLERTKDPRETLDYFRRAINDSVDQRVRECYADKIEFDAAKLGEILLVDGCFVIELLYKHVILRSGNAEAEAEAEDAWMVPTLRHDLSLLENQIPFFILMELYDIFVQHRRDTHPTGSLTSLALTFFLQIRQDGGEEIMPTSKPKHLLDLLHQYYRLLMVTHAGGNIPTGGNQPRGLYLFASRLRKAGIQLEKINEGRPFDITFDGANGVIKISPFSIHETESLFRNLIAFEQCRLSSSSITTTSFHISSYAVVLRSLIRSPRDVKLLQQKGIIPQDLGRGKSILAFMDDICKNLDAKHFYFQSVCDEINRYHSSRRSTWWNPRSWSLVRLALI